jgi:hypothetical protein
MKTTRNEIFHFESSKDMINLRIGTNRKLYRAQYHRGLNVEMQVDVWKKFLLAHGFISILTVGLT